LARANSTVSWSPDQPLTTTTTSTAIVPFDPAFADPKPLALGGFLAGYSGLTRCI
jgi:hypothetical protein